MREKFDVFRQEDGSVLLVAAGEKESIVISYYLYPKLERDCVGVVGDWFITDHVELKDKVRGDILLVSNGRYATLADWARIKQKPQDDIASLLTRGRLSVSEDGLGLLPDQVKEELRAIHGDQPWLHEWTPKSQEALRVLKLTALFLKGYKDRNITTKSPELLELLKIINL